MAKNIMLAFVSLVSPRYLSNPITYPDIQGRAYTAIQTNESAIVYVERMLGDKNSLSKIFLIASDSVYKKIPTANEFGDVTHLEFLKRRITKEFPQLAERFVTQNYSDSSTALEKNILQTAEIADAIMAFANEHADEEIIVHADMTGGFRHASMLMLSIIQLLKYRGIETSEVLYSDPEAKIVYSVTEIQQMFSLITGADEFVNFGSVQALNDYFGANPPPAVKNLLSAMKSFSEAIKICRTSKIEEELKNLGQHIKTFREHPDKDLKSALFAKIIDTIESGYGNLIGNSVERVDIIRWCMKKGFWQQAMTLCTEWLPGEIVRRKICMPTNATIQANCESRARSAHKTWQQYFIIDYTDDKDFCRELRSILENFPYKKPVNIEVFGKLQNFFDEFTAGEMKFNFYRHGKIKNNDFNKKFPTLVAVLKAIHAERKKDYSYTKTFSEFLRTVRYTEIPRIIAKFSNKKLLELFEIDFNKTQSKNLDSVEKIERTWDNREKDYRRMFATRSISLKPDVKTALKILRGYHKIRYERNQINHANPQSTKTIQELKPMIENYLDELENISVSKKNAATL